MKKYLVFLAVLLLLLLSACEIVDEPSETSTSTTTTGDGSTGDYGTNGFDDQVSQDFANAMLTELNFARTDPAGYAAARLKSYYDAGNDNGAYSDFTTKYSSMGKLSLNAQLNAAADKYAKYMGDNDLFEHGDVSGRIEAEGYNWSTYGENIAWSGYDNADASADATTAAQEFVLLWIIDEGYPPTAAGHRINIMTSTFTEVGIGFYTYETSPYNKHYSVQDFGKPQ